MFPLAPLAAVVEARRRHRVRTAGRQARSHVRQRGHAPLRHAHCKQGEPGKPAQWVEDADWRMEKGPSAAAGLSTPTWLESSRPAGVRRSDPNPRSDPGLVASYRAYVPWTGSSGRQRRVRGIIERIGERIGGQHDGRHGGQRDERRGRCVRGRGGSCSRGAAHTRSA